MSLCNKCDLLALAKRQRVTYIQMSTMTVKNPLSCLRSQISTYTAVTKHGPYSLTHESSWMDQFFL